MKGWIDREDSRLLVLLLRTIHRWSQEEMARRARMAQRQISDYETGKTAPEPESLARLTAAAGVPFRLALHVVLPVLRLLRLASLGRRAVERGVAAAGALAGRIGEISTAALAPAVAECLAEVDAVRKAREAAYAPSAAERDGAEALLARLLARTPRQRRLLIRHGRELQSWALAELCCHRSVEAATDDPRLALELAELAGEIAEQVPGEDRWRSRLQGYCRPFLGNARRVASGLAEAERAFAEGRALWQAGEGGDPTGLLDPARALDLEASLRRDQRRFPAALALLDQALARARSGGARARILLKRSATLEQSGDAEGALAALREAIPHVDGERDPRELCVHKFNLAASLCDLGRAAEAESLLPEIRELIERLDRRFDRRRLRWLEGKIAASLGRLPEAALALREVRDGFAREESSFDAALATLELAAVFAEQDATAEVKRLARESEPIFRALGVEPEALAAGRLFQEAAEREALTAVLARQLAERLKKIGASS